MQWQLLHGDVRERLKEIQAGSVQCVVTSPPYWGLRDYGVAGQLGLETLSAYIKSLVEILGAGVGTALRADGTLWLNLGDCYNAYNGGAGPSSSLSRGAQTKERPRLEAGFGLRTTQFKLKPKDLAGVPWRVAFALQDAGWYLRSDIIWSKLNPMPESVTDRPTKAHEYLFLLTKSERYFYDAAAIAEQAEGRIYPTWDERKRDGAPLRRGDPGQSKDRCYWAGVGGNGSTRNRRSVWTIATQPYPEAHFATFPEALVEPCILAGSKPGDLILDPFCGSGTTGAVAIRLQRNFVGIDLNEKYLELARKRIGSVAPLLAQELGA